ncbi:unnamed protein product [Rotaria sp. Silwood1]|nr:unnamed protein product [Rotaria sp. Silwood1]CAF3413099.1 unnamed protein product [Rotaria sp. Silwood1]
MDRSSTFEGLPNELLIDIFEYLPIQDLYKTFFGLNSRLTKIIESLQEFHFEQSELEKIDDSAFAHRITTLVIRHSNNIDLNRYPKLRALKLQWPTKQQCNQTINQSQLEHLYIGHSLYEGDTQQLLKHIFINGFPQLHSCYLENFIGNRSIIRSYSTILPTLVSLKIFTKYSEDIVSLLFLCPNLNQLSIKYFDNAKIDSNIFREWSLMPHKNLHTLIFDSVDQMSIETIDSILAFVPNVTYLSIISPRCNTNKIHIERIAYILHRHLPSLHQFYTSIWLDDLPLSDNYSVNIEAIEWLHPLFKQIKLSSGGQRLIISSSSYRSKLV